MNDDCEKPDISITELEDCIQRNVDHLNTSREAFISHNVVGTSHSKDGWWSVNDAMTISAAVLIFGCVIMVLVTILLYKGRSADDVLKIFGTIVIVIFTAFLVVAGYTDTQIAPVIGLLGTIAGYLLGSRDKDIEKKDGGHK